MYRKLSKNSFYVKVINFVILVSFVFTGIPIRSYAGTVNSDNLRKAAAKNDGTDKKMIRILTEKNREALLSKGMINRLSILSEPLKKISLNDINSIVSKIALHIPKGITAEELSFMVCNDGLWVAGPEREEESQIFILMNADKGNGFSERIKEIVKEAKGELIEQENIVKISLPASVPHARREMLLEIANSFSTQRKVIAEGLTYDQPAYVITPLMERMIFGAKLEKEFLDGFQKDAENAKKEYPELVAFYNHLNDPNSGPFELVIPVKKWKLKERVYETVKALARIAVAGMREVKDPSFAGDLKQPVNMVQLLLVGNELAEMALEQAKKDGRRSIDAIVAGEVRYDTSLMNEQLRRRFAALGITVHSPGRGTYLPIGATSFITTFLDMMFTIYSTSSHSGRAIYSDKLMGFQKLAASPFIERFLAESGINVEEYKKARSEGAQLLIEQMVELAERIGKRIDEAGDSLVIKFAAGNDKNIHFDIQNPSSPGNIDVIKEYAGYLKRGFVSDTNIKTVQDALANGMQMGFFTTRGSAFNFFSGVCSEVFGQKAVGSIKWVDTIPDSFFGDTGMTDFNKKQLPDPFVKKYIEALKDKLDTYFSNFPFRSTVLASISEQDLSGFIKENPRQGKEKDIIKIKLTVFAKEEEDLLKKIGMPYIMLSNDKILVYYRPKIADISQDVSLLEVVNSSKLPAFMSDKPIGYDLDVTDPDGDRYIKIQIVENNKETKEFLKRLNVGFLVLSDKKLLVVYVPNQTFLQIKHAYIQQLKDEKKFSQQIDDPDAVTFFSIKTTVSSGTWLELCTAEGVPVIQVPVGFREISAIMRKIELQIMINRIRQQLGLQPRIVAVHDIFGQPIRIGYNPRELSGGEESGGLVLGTPELLTTKDKTRSYLSWREKNAVDPSIAMLIGISKRFNQARQDAIRRGVDPKALYSDEKFLQDISLIKWLNEIYTQYKMRNTAELRSDIELLDPLEVAKAAPEKMRQMKQEALLRRDFNFAFFLSLAFAFEDGHITLDNVKSILKEVLLADKEMLGKVKSITNDTAPEILLKQLDELKIYKFAGDQVYMEFSNGTWQIIRPSGTDPKIKSYPSTASAIISAVISNAIGEVYPKIFFELAENKIVLDMPATKAFVNKMQEKNPALLNVKAVKDRQQEQYEKGLKVDTMPEWFVDTGVQKLLEDRFPEYTKDSRKVCSVHVFLGPAAQKEALRYDSESHIIYASWSFDDKMQKAENKTELFEMSLKNMPESASGKSGAGRENALKDGGTLSERQNNAVLVAKEALELDGKDDYFIKPTIVDEDTKINEGDSVIIFNFRGDRAEPILRLLTGDSTFKHFPIKNLNLNIVPFAVYNDKYFKEHGIEGVVKESSVSKTLGEVLAENGKTQVRIAESEKFKHVTYFFDGLREITFSGMDTVQIPSNDIDKHWKKPEMKALDIAQETVKWILGTEGKNKKDFVVVNFANLDILGHFEKFDSIVEGALAVDNAMGLIREAVRKAGGVLITTADHGSGEQKVKLDEKGIPILDEEGNPIPHKAHAFDNKVPFIIEGAGNVRLKQSGSLKNIAPTILELMGIKKPSQMTADSLVEGAVDKTVNGPVVLVIRDGWGISKFKNPEALKYNAVYQAHLRAQKQGIKFNDDELLANNPHTELWAHGEYVGHPAYQMGDSENGHSNIGAGREVPSTLFTLDKMLETGEFTNNKIVHQAIENAKKDGHRLHLIGMVSEGGVHSHIQHLFKLLQVISKEKEGMNNIVLHPIFDGRDIETSETPGWESLRQVFQVVNKLNLRDIFKIGVMSGRYYAMDRDALNRDKKGVQGSHELWLERLKPWYDAIVYDQGRSLILNNPEKFDGGIEKIAKELKANVKETADFFDAHNRIFKLTGGETALRDYLKAISEWYKSLRQQSTNLNKSADKGLAVVVQSSFFKNGAALDALKEIIKWKFNGGPLVTLGIYGKGAGKAKALFGDSANVITANTVEELKPELEKRVLNFEEDVVVLKPLGQKVNLGVKQVTYSDQTLSTVTVAKAVEVLMPRDVNHNYSGVVFDRFQKFYNRMEEEKVISPETYANTREQVCSQLVLPDIEPAQKISDKIENDAVLVSKFMDMYV